MKKNRTLRVSALLLALTLITTCFVGGTFAKYTSSAGSNDQARVAYWGFKDNAMDITGLFKNAYETTVNGDTAVNDTITDVIAPGTTGSATFAFAYAGTKAPEVAYTFKVEATGSECADSIKNNRNILWKLDGGAWGTWDAMITAIEALDGNADGDRYEPNTLPEKFTTADDQHTISWKWIFDENALDKENGTANNDVGDTAMGNVDAGTLAQVKVVVKITATQID